MNDDSVRMLAVLDMMEDLDDKARSPIGRLIHRLSLDSRMRDIDREIITLRDKASRDGASMARYIKRLGKLEARFDRLSKRSMKK